MSLYPAQAKKLEENCDLASLMAKLPMVSIKTVGALPLRSVERRRSSKSDAPRSKLSGSIVLFSSAATAMVPALSLLLWEFVCYKLCKFGNWFVPKGFPYAEPQLRDV